MTHNPGFADLFRDTRDLSYGPFELSSIEELDGTRPQLVEFLAQALLDHKTDPTVFSDLVHVLGWETAFSTIEQTRISIRHGDLGEVIAAEAAQAFDGQMVPVIKLRYQIDPNQTLPGSDVVGFELDHDGGISNLRIYEAKFRINPSLGILVDAHEQLTDAAMAQFATTIRFLAERLRESDSELYEALMIYLEDRGDTDSFSHAICLSCDGQGWNERSLDVLRETPGLLDPLLVRVALFIELRDLADSVWDAIADTEGDESMMRAIDGC